MVLTPIITNLKALVIANIWVITTIKIMILAIIMIIFNESIIIMRIGGLGALMMVCLIDGIRMMTSILSK